MPQYTSLITLAAVLVYFYTGIRVAQARARTGVKAPATTGNPEFERSFRVQMNTLEWMPIMLPSMWLFAFYVEDGWAAALGGVWIMGRALYIRGYSEAAEKRGTGFSIQALAAGVLWVGALIGVVLNLMKIH
jgi:glutathione S-transferase